MLWSEYSCSSIIQGDRLQIPFKLVANLWKTSKSKFLTTALLLKDIKIGPKSRTENFPSIKLYLLGGW